MNLDFLKAVSAKVEGRTAVVIGGLAFCCFGIWIVARLPPSAFSTILLFLFAILGSAVVLIPLLGKPQPSEPTPKFVIQQVGSQTIYTGGHHSTDEMINLLREVRNIQPLPPPSAVVIGSPQSHQYRQLSPIEAEELQRKDEMGVEGLLRSEIETMRARIRSAQLAGGRVQDTKSLPSQKPDEDRPSKNFQSVIEDRSSASGENPGTDGTFH